MPTMLRIFGLVIFLGVISTGLTASVASAGDNEPGCCSCACRDLGGGEPFETCVDFAMGGRPLCAQQCGMLNCQINFFEENVLCTDPSLAETCGEPTTMAPVASNLGVFAVLATLTAFGAMRLRRSRIAPTTAVPEG